MIGTANENNDYKLNEITIKLKKSEDECHDWGCSYVVLTKNSTNKELTFKGIHRQELKPFLCQTTSKGMR